MEGFVSLQVIAKPAILPCALRLVPCTFTFLDVLEGWFSSTKDAATAAAAVDFLSGIVDVNLSSTKDDAAGKSNRCLSQSTTVYHRLHCPSWSTTVCHSLSQCVAVCHYLSQSPIVCRSLPLSVAVCRSLPQSTTVYRSIPQSTTVYHTTGIKTLESKHLTKQWCMITEKRKASKWKILRQAQHHHLCFVIF